MSRDEYDPHRPQTPEQWLRHEREEADREPPAPADLARDAVARTDDVYVLRELLVEHSREEPIPQHRDHPEWEAALQVYATAYLKALGVTL